MVASCATTSGRAQLSLIPTTPERGLANRKREQASPEREQASPERELGGNLEQRANSRKDHAAT